MNDTTNQNGHANGRNKVLELAPVKTAEEIQQEVAREIAPKIRGQVWFASGLPISAKGFFAFLLDMSFLHKAGGTGGGKLFTSTRWLARHFKCDKDSITKWRRDLAQKHFIWYRERWPRSVYGILALCPEPADDLPWDDELFNAGKSESEEAVRQKGTVLFLAENGLPPRKDEENGQLAPEKPDALSPGTGQSVPQNRTRGGILRDTSVPQNRTGGGIEPDAVSDEAGRTWRALGDKVSGSVGTTKETPMEKRSKGATECVPGAPGLPTAHTALKFEPLDNRMVMRLRRTHGKDMIERLVAKKNSLEMSRKPPANRKALADAYSGRIRDIKDWMDGILEEKAVGK